MPSHTGSVWLPCSISVSARMNSFQAWMNANTAVATSPGAISGNVIRQNAPQREAPSIIAASSSSTGSAATNPRSVHTVNGSTNAMYVAISTGTRLSRSASRSVRYIGMTSASSGTICTIRMTSRYARRPRNRNRATAVAASSATSTASTVTDSETTTLLRRKVQNPAACTAVRKLLQRHRVREQRDVEGPDVAGRLERGGDHPVDGEREQHEHDQRGDVGRDRAAAALCARPPSAIVRRQSLVAPLASAARSQLLLARRGSSTGRTRPWRPG